MPLPASSRIQFTDDLTMCRNLDGMWQVSDAHGAIDLVRAVDATSAYHEAGFTTWDLADHYGPAEYFIGEFRRRFAARHGVDRLPGIQAFTKWMPHPGRMTRRVVEDAISISLTRMGVDRLDLLPFHWWDYENNGYLAMTPIPERSKLSSGSRCGIERAATSTTDLSSTIAASKVDVGQCHDELRNFLRCRTRMRQHVPAATRCWQHMRKAAIALHILATA